MNRCIKVLQTSPLATWVRRRQSVKSEPQTVKIEKSDSSFSKPTRLLDHLLFTEFYGAGNGIRTRDPNLGKVVLYQLSYSRILTRRHHKFDRTFNFATGNKL